MPELLHDHLEVGHDGQTQPCQGPEKAVEHWHPFSVWTCQHTVCNLHQPPLFQRWLPLLSLLFLAEWLTTSRHFSPSETPETGNAKGGHSHVHLESVLLNTERALFGGWRSQALQPWEQQACCAPRLHPHSTSSSIPSSLWPSAGWVSAAGGSLTPTALKQTTFHLLDL